MPKSTTRKEPKAVSPPWADASDEKLLAMRICDLGVTLRGSWLKEPINQLLRELRQRDIVCKPHFWLADDWYTPDGVPGIAIPFFLAHPRLMELEKKQILEIEGGDHLSCMRILRHEMGHVLDNAYRLHRRARYRQLFGRFSQPYPDYYRPRPYSKRFVLHLDSWYAQAHPAEDFAETFAVWITPDSKWETRYAGWPARKKLIYVDELMREIAGKTQPVKSSDRTGAVRTQTMTLTEYYDAKRERYGQDYPDFYDRDLRRLFSIERTSPESIRADRFLRGISPHLRRIVSRWTGEYQYTINQVLREMVSRLKELDLWLNDPVEKATVEAMVMLTVQTMNYLHSGYHRVAL